MLANRLFVDARAADGGRSPYQRGLATADQQSSGLRYAPRRSLAFILTSTLVKIAAGDRMVAGYLTFAFWCRHS